MLSSPGAHSFRLAGLGLVGWGPGFTSISHSERGLGQGRASAQFFPSVCRLTWGGSSLGNSSSQDSPARAPPLAPRTEGKETPAADGREALWGSPSPSSPGGSSQAPTRSGTPGLPVLPLFLLRPGSGAGAGLNFNQCRDRAGAGRELIRKRRRGSPERSALPGSGDSAAPAPSPGSGSPQVASGRGGGVTAVTRPPLRENAVSRALHQPRGGGSGGRRVPSAAAGLCPAAKRREPEQGGGARAFGGDRSLRPLPPAGTRPIRGAPAVTLKPPSCPAGERRGQLPHSAPQKVCPGGGGGTHVLRRRRRPLLGLGFQLLDALRLGAGGHCGARAGVLSHADAGSRAGGRLWGSSRRAGLTLRGAGRAAPGALCAPRRLRASPAARARPHGPGPRVAASPPRDARPLAAKLLRARGPAGLRPGPHARLRGEGALGPAPAPRLPALPSRFPRPQLCAGVSSSPRTPRGRRAGGGGAAPGDRRPPPPPPPPGRHHQSQIGQSVAAPGGEGAELRRGWRGSGCTARGGGGDVRASGGGAGRAAPSVAPLPPASSRGPGLSRGRGGVQCPLPETHRVNDHLEAADA